MNCQKNNTYLINELGRCEIMPHSLRPFGIRIIVRLKYIRKEKKFQYEKQYEKFN